MARSSRPPQEEGRQPLPRVEARHDCTRKLTGKTALVTAGDSGIGCAIALAVAKEGADIAIIYLNRHRKAEEVRQRILRENVRCILIAGDVTREDFCRNAVKRTIAAFRRLDIIVNNTTERLAPDSRETAAEQRERNLGTDLLGMFRLTKAAMRHLRAGSTIINTTAVTAWCDSAQLIEDAATTGTIVSFTRSLAGALVGQGICVNAVTPGSAHAREKITATYVFLAAQHGSFVTGQVLHPKAGEVAA
jgi:NAD(P)-dependent dehydrogenase (short-subunit alcohol dehydrogenase family)